ncbi:MAG: hypothetical protein OEU99_14270 [Nitrospira sp.]|nr:hypothetical protein [Nitrospira sp.]
MKLGRKIRNAGKNLGRKIKNSAKTVGRVTKVAARGVTKVAKKGRVRKAVGKVVRATPVGNVVATAAQAGQNLARGHSLKEVAMDAAKGTSAGRIVTGTITHGRTIGKVINAGSKGNGKRAVTIIRKNPVVKDRLEKLQQYRDRTALLENVKNPRNLLNPKNRERDLKTLKEYVKK